MRILIQIFSFSAFSCLIAQDKYIAEINLDDLGLDISGLDETELASLDDLDSTSATNEAISMTGVNEALEDLEDLRLAEPGWGSLPTATSSTPPTPRA